MTESGGYCGAEVCLAGHVIRDVRSYGSDEPPLVKYCTTCGAPVIYRCVHHDCKAPILGSFYYDDVGDWTWQGLHAYCHNCGNPYPWTEAALRAAEALADDQEQLTDQEREVLKSSILDVVRDTPMVTVAVGRIQRLGAKAGPAAMAGLREILIGLITEATKQRLWPGS
jgi:hypothetical protein